MHTYVCTYLHCLRLDDEVPLTLSDAATRVNGRLLEDWRALADNVGGAT